MFRVRVSSVKDQGRWCDEGLRLGRGWSLRLGKVNVGVRLG